MKKYFFDTNILLDILLKREPFYISSLLPWKACEEGRVKGFVSALSIMNLHDIIRKALDDKAALSAVSLSVNLFDVVPLSLNIIRSALEDPGQDFEDAVQVYSALSIKAKGIITRDRPHFLSSRIPLLTPADFVHLEHLEFHLNAPRAAGKRLPRG